MTKPLHLLVVEDETSVGRALRRVLERMSHTVTLCSTVAEARAKNEIFDAAIFDIELPDGSGLDLAEELLSTGRVKKAVFFSGTVDVDARERAAELGRFVEKQRGIQELVSELFEALGQHADVRLAACAEGHSESAGPPPTAKRRRKPS